MLLAGKFVPVHVNEIHRTAFFSDKELARFGATLAREGKMSLVMLVACKSLYLLLSSLT